MITTKIVKRSIAILALAGILVITAVFGMMLFLPAAYAEEELECIRCYAGTYTTFHYGKELPTLRSYREKGIIMSKSDNKFLDNTTVDHVILQMGTDRKRKGYALFKIIDPEGDIIIGEDTYTGLVRGGKFLQGSGKYKGIKGSFISQRGGYTQRLKRELEKHLEGFGPIRYQFCRTWKGKFELPK